jgi:hypothetical protein
VAHSDLAHGRRKLERFGAKHDRGLRKVSDLKGVARTGRGLARVRRRVREYESGVQA